MDSYVIMNHHVYNDHTEILEKSMEINRKSIEFEIYSYSLASQLLGEGVKTGWEQSVIRIIRTETKTRVLMSIFSQLAMCYRWMGIFLSVIDPVVCVISRDNQLIKNILLQCWDCMHMLSMHVANYNYILMHEPVLLGNISAGIMGYVTYTVTYTTTYM